MTLGPLAVTRVNAPKAATASVIFLHGLGDSGDGWSFLPSEVYQRPSLQHINFILPSAPVRPITAFGESVPGWFDVYGFGGKTGSDKEGILKALATIKYLVNKEIEKGVPADRIVVGGFSQGAALTEGTAVTIDKKLAGFIAISGFLPEPKTLQEMQTGVNRDTPMLMLHGTADQVVPYKMGNTSYEVLKSSKFGMHDLIWRSYEGLAHSIDVNGLNDIINFLETTLPAK